MMEVGTSSAQAYVRGEKNCDGRDAVFAEDAYESLRNAGTADIVTCNTVPHASNAINLTHVVAEGVHALLRKHVEAVDVLEQTS